MSTSGSSPSPDSRSAEADRRQREKKKGTSIVYVLAGLGALAMVAMVAVMAVPVYYIMSTMSSLHSRVGGDNVLAIGAPAPQLEAEGWINGEPPDELSGKVVVVEAWAHWCGPCRMKAPHIVELYNRYKDQGVVFVGLTGDDGSQLAKIRQFVEQYKIEWPNGYGAESTLGEFKQEYYPCAWVIGRDNRIAWNESSDTSLEDGIKEALQEH